MIHYLLINIRYLQNILQWLCLFELKMLRNLIKKEVAKTTSFVKQICQYFTVRSLESTSSEK